jgi:secretion/DNA translocation related TadE-like protein
VTLAGLLLVVSLVAAGLGRLLVDPRRAAAAADLAALAGAAALQQSGDGCAAAHRTAAANGARLVGCRVSGDHVVVRSFVAPPEAAGLLGLVLRAVRVEAEAHGGPVDPGPANG